MKHIVHIIPSLQRGGAEQTLIRLISHTNPSLFQHSIICLKEAGPLLEQAKPHLKHFIVIQNYPWGFFKLIKILKEWHPDMVQTWMYSANIFGGLAAKFAHRKKIFWNIRTSHLDWRYNSLASIIFCRLGSLFSFLASKIVCNSKEATKVHIKLGYPEYKFIYIPNGFDTHLYKPSLEKYQAFRKQYTIPSKAFVIGMLARFHTQKDFPAFLRAAELLVATHPQVMFVLAGHKVTAENPDLAKLIPDVLKDRCILLGDHATPQDILPTFDLFTLASRVEAFPNVVAEAMACGVPTVSSDVGDANLIIGNTGWIVPPGNPEAILTAWKAALQSDLKTKGAAARKRIEENFSLQKMIDAYTNLYIQD